jgi:hypothetical protein
MGCSAGGGVGVCVSPPPNEQANPTMSSNEKKKSIGRSVFIPFSFIDVCCTV